MYIVYKNYVEMREWFGQLGQWLLTATDKYWELGSDEGRDMGQRLLNATNKY